MKVNKYAYKLISLVLGTTVLSGCDQFRHTFGLDHAQGDPFVVPTNPPLSMPPNYDLRPPLPGNKNPKEIDHSDQAHQKMLGSKKSLTKTAPHTEKDILATASKKGVADPAIRHKVADEPEGNSFIDKIKNLGRRVKENISQGSKGKDFREEEAAPKLYEAEQHASQEK